MFITNQPIKMIFVTGILLITAGCSGEPSDSDVKNAITKQAKADVDAIGNAGGAFGKSMKEILPEIKSAKKIGCKSDGEKAYKCDVELDVVQLGTASKGIVPIRFVKGSDGWVATK